MVGHLLNSKFSAAMADYIVYGMGKVKATPGDVPDHAMRKKLIKVSCHIHRYACEMVTESHYLASLIPVENNIYSSNGSILPVCYCIFTMQLQKTTNVEEMRALLYSDEFDFRYDVGVTQLSHTSQFADELATYK